MTKLIYVALITAFVNNVFLSSHFGVKTALDGANDIKFALKTSISVIIVTTVASIITWPINEFVLSKLNLNFLQTVVFILIEFMICAIAKSIIKKTSPDLNRSFGNIPFLIPINSAVLGVIITNVQSGYGFLRSTVNSFCGALGFAIALVILAGIKDKIRFNDVPTPFEGTPILLVSAGLMAIAFYGFSSLI